MTLDCLRSALPGGAALATLLLGAASAHAEGEACLRDTACLGSELCLGGTCTTPQTAPPACGDGCNFDEACVDGFCKTEGIACDNPGGRCWVEQDHGLCECFSGDGVGWSDGFNPDDPPQTQTDDELLTRCTDVLVETCGTQPPMLPSSCAGEVRTDCEAFVELESAAIGDCGDGTPEVNIARVGRCCDTYDEPSYAAYRMCLLEGDAPTCALLASCEDDAGTGGLGEGNDGDTDAGADPSGTDTDAQGAGADNEDTSSCSVGPGNRGWTLLGLFALMPWARRRRGRPGSAAAAPPAAAAATSV